jgi:hypothetical protein
MNRRLVLYLALGGASLALAALALLTLPIGLGNGSNAPGGASPGGLLVYALGICGGIPLVGAALVMALVQTAQLKRWRWFGVLLGLGALTVLLSGVISIYAPWAFLICPLSLVAYGILGQRTAHVTSAKSVRPNQR